MSEQITFDFDAHPVIKGYPELRWTGKRPYKSTQYYPAQLKETYGTDTDNWLNKIFWGDNLQVMSHLLQKYRGKIDLIYIDPPFDSKADYKKKIQLKGKTALGDASSFEEKQYGDIWTNDEYLQFMYERLILLRELLADTGSIYLHCDYRKSSHLRLIMDEVFGADNFVNEIIWSYKSGGVSNRYFARKHDTLLLFAKSPQYFFDTLKEKSYNRGFKPYRFKDIQEFKDEIGWYTLVNMRDVWEIDMVGRTSRERLNYPTQKPEALLKRIIKASSNPGDLIFDCFMGSGTTQAVAMKLGRRFIGADINLGAIQTTTKRLINVARDLRDEFSLEVTNSDEMEQVMYVADSDQTLGGANKIYTGFEVYNVNNYDFFRNPVEAKQLLVEALGIQAFPPTHIWDGELDGRMVKLMPVDRIASKADLEALIANLPYHTYEKRKESNPNQSVEMITIVCMGHEPDLKAYFDHSLKDYKVDIEIVDILRDKAELQFKREAEAEVVKDGNYLEVRSFYPLNLMQKLSIQKEYVEDWRELVESIVIDWNYDGAIMHPSTLDIPEKNELVKGRYKIPAEAGTVRIKISDLLAESLEKEVVV